MKIKLSSWILFVGLCLGCKTRHTFIAEAKASGGLADKNLRYVGRWNFADTAAMSYWGGAYVRANFSGTSVKMLTGHRTNFYAKIDNGPWVSFLNKVDTVELTPVPLNKGWHTITVAQGKDYDYIFNFKGFIFDKDAHTKPANISPILIEYVGDSITAGYTDAQADVSDYGWITSELLGTEHTQIAYPGINLASGYKSSGMDVVYMKERSAKFPDSKDWNFNSYAPQIVTINLGTNDTNNKVPDSVFTRSYVKLITAIRTKFPKAKIFAMRTFIGIKQQATINAVNEFNLAGDKNVYYLDTTGWITQKTEDYNDSAHPSVSGQQKVAKLLAEKLRPYINDQTK
jgi:lysophospholipase L1-like esterase